MSPPHPRPPTAFQSALQNALQSALQSALHHAPPHTLDHTRGLELAASAALQAMAAATPAAPPPSRASVRAALAAATAAAGGAAARQRAAQREAQPASTPRSRKPRRTAPAPRAAAVRVTDLSALAQHLREQQARAQALEKARRAAAARREAEQQFFARAVGPVTPLRDTNLAQWPALVPEPLPLQLGLDEERALLESISDDFDVSTLLDTDDQLSYRRPGIGVEITQRLRAGHWSIQRQLDLHGLRIDEARESLGQFIRQVHKAGLRCVRVVHGKGLGSPGRTPVLKGREQRWLVQKNEVLAFVQARAAEGGAGALVVLLQPGGQSRA